MFPVLAVDRAPADLRLPAFLVARDGVYLRKRTLLGVSQTKVARIAHLPAAEEAVAYALPRVPADLMGRVVGFFRAVYRRQGSEALVLLLWEAGRFAIHVPRQRASADSVEFRLAAGELPAGARLVGTIHSHAAFGAFASPTDEADEADLDGLHLVVGDLDRDSPSYAAAIVVDGRRFRIALRRVLERPRRTVEPPPDWLARVTRRRAPRPKGATSGQPWPSCRWLSPPAAPGRPSPSELEALLDRAARLAEALGYRLRASLSPLPRAGEPGGADDA